VGDTRNFHEEFSEGEAPKPPSKRRFGFLMTAAFLFVALLPLTRHAPIHIWALAVAAVFFVSAVFLPRFLTPIFLLWMQIGPLMQKVVTPIFLGLLFYGVFVPTGFLMRLFGKRPLGLALEPGRKSYWIERGPSEPQGMTRQF
jgi:hypothetical protein